MTEEQLPVLQDEASSQRRMPDNLRKFLLRVQGGKFYLPAAYRVVWFRDECPEWGIDTMLIEGGEEAGFATVQAKIFNSEGRLIASGIKTESRKDFPAGHVEKAETGAVARALAIAGFGTQWSEDLNEGEKGGEPRYSDSPQGRPVQPQGQQRPATQRQAATNGTQARPVTSDAENEERARIRGAKAHAAWLKDWEVPAEHSLTLLSWALQRPVVKRSELNAAGWEAANRELAKLGGDAGIRAVLEAATESAKVPAGTVSVREPGERDPFEDE